MLDGMSDTANRVRHNRLRRMGDRQGLTVQRSPRRDPHSLGYGRWAITLLHPADGGPEQVITRGRSGDSYALTTDELERFLSRDTETYRLVIAVLRAQVAAGVRESYDHGNVVDYYVAITDDALRSFRQLLVTLVEDGEWDIDDLQHAEKRVHLHRLASEYMPRDPNWADDPLAP